MVENESKRLFFGFEVDAPWPSLPEGRMIKEKDRHVTVAFLDRLPGEVEPDGEGVPRLDGGVALGLCVQESSQPVRAGLLVRYFLSNACRQRIFTSSEARGNCGPDPRNR